MRKSLTVIVVLSLTLLLLPGWAYQPSGPVPEKAHKSVPRAWTEAQVDAMVVREEQVISAPLPSAWGAPAAADEIHYLRYRLADNSTVDPSDPQGVNVKNTDAMLVMLPGVLEGGSCFEYLARQFIYMAKLQNHLNIEIWSVERRNNRLEDLSALKYVEGQVEAGKITAMQGAEVLVDFCYHGGTINGQKFTGWLSDKDLPCLSEFGLQLDTEDVFKVIQTMVPDRSVRKKKVFVGGHSMGGIMTSMFAGWDLDGNLNTTDDAGYNNCAGLFGVDTFVGAISEIVDPTLDTIPSWLKDMIKAEKTESVYSGLLSRLRIDPTSNRILPFPLLNAEAMSLLEVIGMLAYYQPNVECTVIKKIPLDFNLRALLDFMCSRDFTNYINHVPRLTDFRFTNAAMLGMVFDDSTVPLGMIQASMGFLGGGPVVKKSFPLDYIKAIPVVGDMIASSFGTGPYYIPTDAGPSKSKLGKGPLYNWVNFDQVGTKTDPNFQDTKGKITYTTTTNEVSDMHDVARTLFMGPTNMVEWYFSTRLVMDFVAALYPYAPKYGINFLRGKDAGFKALPKIEFLAGQGMMTSMMRSLPPNGTKRIVLKGYNHLDVMMASANTPTRRQNEVIKPLISFIKSHL